MGSLMKMKNVFNSVIDNLLAILIGIMVVVVSFTVFSRYLFSYTPRWSEEVALLMLIWVSFIGIAIGFRDKLHIGVGAFVGMLPKKYQAFFDYFAKVLVVVVAIIFIIYGYNFTVLMSQSTMAGTGLPQSVLYGAIPSSGVLMLIYGIELFFKKGMHQEWDTNIEE